MKILLVMIPFIFIFYEVFRQKKVLTFGIFFNVLSILYLAYGTLELDLMYNYNKIVIYSSIFAIIGFNTGYITLKKYNEGYKKVNFNLNYDLVIYGFITIATCVQLFLIFKIGIDNFIFSDRVYRAGLLKAYGSLFFYEFWFNIAGLLSLHRYFETKEKKYLWIFILCFSNIMFLSIVSISRSAILYSLLPLIYYLNKMNKLSNKTISVILSSIFIIFLFIRGVMYKQFLGVDVGENVQLGELVTWRRIFLNVLPYYEHQRLYGYSYLQTLISFVNPLYKGESLSVWYVKTFEYNYYLSGGGRGFSGVAEGYINLGYFGVFAYFYLLGKIFKFFQTKDNNFWIFICGSYLMVNSYRIFRAESFTVFKYWYWFIVIPIIVSYIFIQRINSKEKSKEIKSMERLKIE